MVEKKAASDLGGHTSFWVRTDIFENGEEYLYVTTNTNGTQETRFHQLIWNMHDDDDEKL